MKLLVTGGAGFIGSAFVRYILSESAATSVVTLDKLTYAGNLENLASVLEDRRHRFVHGDICDRATVASILQEGDIDAIVHFAAESHVDRSILSPDHFVETNIRGTATLLDAARQAKTERFVLVSTDEVYGDIEAPLEADETFPLKPSSPYAASKAAADLLALSYFRTFSDCRRTRNAHANRNRPAGARSPICPGQRKARSRDRLRPADVIRARPPRDGAVVSGTRGLDRARSIG